MSKRKNDKPETQALPLTDASRRLRAQARRRSRRSWSLMDAVLCPPSGTPLRLVASAARSANGAGKN